jgi:hypothetical protein
MVEKVKNVNKSSKNGRKIVDKCQKIVKKVAPIFVFDVATTSLGVKIFSATVLAAAPNPNNPTNFFFTKNEWPPN